jgi:hypothetical protein
VARHTKLLPENADKADYSDLFILKKSSAIITIIKICVQTWGAKIAKKPVVIRA